MKLIKYSVAAIGTAMLLTMGVTAYSADEKTVEHHGWHQRDGGPDDGRGHRGFKGPGFAKLLNLTDAQKKALKDFRDQQEPVQSAQREKIRSAHEALNKAGEANVDDAQLNKLANDLAALIAQEEVSRVKAHQQFISILTPEQKTELAQWEADRKDGLPRGPKGK